MFNVGRHNFERFKNIVVQNITEVNAKHVYRST